MAENIEKLTKKIWSGVSISGAIGIVFGLITVLWPSQTTTFFIYLFSILVLIASVVALGQAFSSINTNRLWWLTMLFAVCGISLGLYIMVNPNSAKGFMAVLLAIYIFSQSLLDLVAASYSDDQRMKTPVIIIGILGVIFGFLVLLYPTLAADTMVWVVGLYILAHSISIEIFSYRAYRAIKGVKKAIKASLLNEDEVDDEETDKAKSAKKAKVKKSTKKDDSN